MESELFVSTDYNADGKPAYDHMSILNDSVRKRNRKEVLANYNKTRIGIGQLILECKHLSGIAHVVWKLGHA